MNKPTRGERNNNPGNIRPSLAQWRGQSGIDAGKMGQYIIFSEPKWGIRAIARDLRTKFARGLNNVRSIISAYAPPEENPTEAYIKSVCAELGVLSTTKLDLTDKDTLRRFVHAIIKHENGRVIYTDEQIAEGVDLV